ncbi:FixH family protein [Tistrella bauzanensis]|jgi:nitrogen fixation protein FixH|uniref:FixH family protein n=1 Tax=Tistrella arctica TaxID=3133430 RepID=A0ABU9YDA3_9PROT
MTARIGPPPPVRMPGDPAPRPSDRWIPRAIIGFFLVLGSVQAGFVTIAYDSFTGLVTDDAYATGLSYDRVLKERAAEAALGWRIDARYLPDAADPRRGRLVVGVADAGGVPLDGIVVQGEAEHTGRIPQLLPITFAPRAGDGAAMATLAFPNGGHWFIRLKLTRGADEMRHLVELPVVR